MFYHLDLEKLGAKVTGATDAADQAEAAATEARTQAEAAAEMMAELVKASDWRGRFAALCELIRDHEREQFPRGRPMNAKAEPDHHLKLYTELDAMLTEDVRQELPFEVGRKIA
jgi:hypothetical protein